MPFPRLLIASLYLVATLTQAASIDAAIKKGEAFLLKKVRGHQFSIYCQSTNSFHPCLANDTGQVHTGFHITQALIATQKSLPNDVRGIILDEISKAHTQTGWGYSKDAPSDADDTSLAIYTLTSLHEPVSLDVFDDYYIDQLGAYTMFVTQPEDNWMDLMRSKNGTPQPSINANIYHAYGMNKQPDKINFSTITALQNDTGAWPSYPYTSQYYASYASLTLLCKYQPKSKAIKKGLRFIESTQNKNGSWGKPANAYDTALAVTTLIDCGNINEKTLKPGISYILKTQRKNGSWSYDSPIWNFEFLRSTSVYWTAFDKNHVITTSLAILSLAKYKKATHEA